MADIFYDRVKDDIVLSNGDLKLTSDEGREEETTTTTTSRTTDSGLSGGAVETDGKNEGIKQNITSVLLTFAGEYFLDSENSVVGVPWIQEIFSVKPLPAITVDRVVRNAILSVNGVASVDELQIDFERGDRNLEVNFIARTDDGSLVSDTILVGRAQ